LTLFPEVIENKEEKKFSIAVTRDTHSAESPWLIEKGSLKESTGISGSEGCLTGAHK